MDYYNTLINGLKKSFKTFALSFILINITSQALSAKEISVNSVNSLGLISRVAPAAQFEKLIDPNEKYVIHRIDDANRNLAGIFSRPIDGSSPPIRLNDPLPLTGFHSFNFKISPDGKYVVYTSGQNAVSVRELFSVPIDGSSAPIKLNDTLTEGGFVRSFEISPDSQFVVYNADQINGNVINLFVAPINVESDSSRIDPDAFTVEGDLISGNVSSNFKITPDSQNVVYITNQTSNFDFELFRVSIDGGTRQRLNDDLVADNTIDSDPASPDGNVTDFKISNNGQRVVYLADQIADGQVELFTVTINGNDRSRLNSDLIDDGDVIDFTISEDSQYVVYQANQNSNTVFEIFSAKSDGANQATRLNTNLASGDVTNFKISPNSEYVIYTAQQNTELVNELYSTPIDGGSSIRLNDENLASNSFGQTLLDADVFNFEISPDSQHVVYRVSSNFSTRLFKSPIRSTNSTIQLSTEDIRGSVQSIFSISADSQRVTYLGALFESFRNDLINVSINGGDSTIINSPPLNTSGSANVFEFIESPSSEFIIYLASRPELELFSIQLNVEDLEEQNGAELCFPIPSKNNDITIICL